MKNKILLLLILLALTAGFGPKQPSEKLQADIAEMMKESVVYLNVTSQGYEHYEPWKRTSVSVVNAYGCAVGKYTVITTARNLRNTAFIKVRRHGQNEFIPAKLRVIDYESNLALVDLDPDKTTVPLKPVTFFDDYKKSSNVGFYYLTKHDNLRTGRGILDRAEVHKSAVSYSKFLNFVIGNVSQARGSGEIYYLGSKAIGIGCWSNQDKKRTGLIPAITINKFLADAADDTYEGFGALGFNMSSLLNPTARAYLKLPPSVTAGSLVADVYNIGTASDTLKVNDVVVAIDGTTLDAHAKITDPSYGRLLFHHLITSKAAGDTITFDLWRDGKEIQLQTTVTNFAPEQMLVPYYELDRQSEYVITAGFILQKLTRPYMAQWGNDWPGKVSPHLYHYYRNKSFKPTAERSDIVILSYVLPADINLGYQNLGQKVVKKFNGMKISSISDIPIAQKLNPDSPYDIIEFELDEPTVVIPREKLPEADLLIANNYQITKLSNVYNHPKP